MHNEIDRPIDQANDFYSWKKHTDIYSNYS